MEQTASWTASGTPDEDNLILIIDDSADAIRLLNSMLKGLGQVVFATNGADGVAIARQRRPQLILLDVDMEGMDGYETCKILHGDPDLAGTSIMFVTAHTTIESEVEALEAGAVDFISKPLNAPLVRARVRTHLRLANASAKLQQLARRDGLTGLYNRRYFDEQLGREFLRHKRQLLPLSLAFIDIDHFKPYNDHYGHQQGDACLAQVAAALAQTVHRPGEVAARYGGEEFVILLPYTSGLDAERFGKLICQRVADLAIPHAKSSAGSIVTVSVGLATTSPGGGGTAASLVAAADNALYQAKAGGRARAVLASYGD